MIYLDYNATTPLCDEAREAMLPYLQRDFGNPSSVHAAGRVARAAIDDARDKIAQLIGAKPHEIIFTSGGTESCNLAVLGLARASHVPDKLDGFKPSSLKKRAQIISNKVEHHAVLHAIEHLEKHEGFEVTWLNVSENGIVDLDHLVDSLRDDTAFVSIMTANNETGVIQPMREISKICRERGVLLHSDMVQSFGKIETDIALVDAASFAAHKFYGPKGAGFLYLRAGIPIEAIQFGGSHENERRPGTENVAAIAGMAAGELLPNEQEKQREQQLRDDLWEKIAQSFPDAVQNGDIHHRLANTLNVSFPGLSSETLLMALDLEGVCASSGSACMVGSVVASHVLLGMGLSKERAGSAIRFSLGRNTTEQEIDETAKAIARIMDRLKKTAVNAVALSGVL